MRHSILMTETTDSSEGDNYGFVNIPLMAREVEAVVYMREVQPNAYRVSLRSKGDINVAKISEKFGGGGHKNAAGCKVIGNWDDRENELVKTISEAIEDLHS